jgi:hypothetical protein
MSETTRSYPLLEELVHRIRLPWYGAAALVAAVLMVLLVVLAYLDGVFDRPFEWGFWRIGLQSPVIITYILAIYPLTQRMWDRAVRSLGPLLDVDQRTRDGIMENMYAVSRRWEWLALILGASFWILLSQPWSWVENWLDLYAVGTGTVMFGLLGWLINGAARDTRQLTRLNRRYVKPDIYNPGLMTPIAQWSLGISVAFVGGITISVAFQPWDNLKDWRTVVIYAVLLCVTILIFFISQWSTHDAMARAKRNELSLARENLGVMLRELKEKTARGSAEGIEKLYSAVAAWGTYERRVQEARVWPYNANVLLRLGASALFPTIVYLLKILFGVRLTP